MIELVNANSIAIPLAPKSVQLGICSPPYLGLRSYGGMTGEIGSEATPEEFIDALVAVGREMWRVLRDDGVWVVNLGSSYASGDTVASQSRQPRNVLSYGKSDIAPEDYQGLGYAYHGLDDAQRADFRNHLRRRLNTGLPPLRLQQLSWLKDRDTWRWGSVSELPFALPLVSLVSTTLLSWLLSRGVYSPEGLSASTRLENDSAFLVARLSTPGQDDPPSPRSTSGDTRETSPVSCDNPNTSYFDDSLVRRILDMVFDFYSWEYYKPSPHHYQAGDNMNIPHRVAAALQADGWLWRDTIIWRKKSAMPESVNGWRWERCRVRVAQDKTTIRKSATNKGSFNEIGGNEWERDAYPPVWADCLGCPKCADTDGLVLRRGSWRTTTAHEYIFVFAKAQGYFADREAVKVAAKEQSVARALRGVSDDHKYVNGAPGQTPHTLGQPRDHGEGYPMFGANPRDVMTFKPTPYRGAHYATFPITLPEFFIKAFTPEAGSCSVCGAPWARVVDRESSGRDIEAERAASAASPGRTDGHIMGPGNKIDRLDTLGHRRTCEHDAPARPAIVCDPFIGSGSTLIAARKLGRHGVGFDLNLDYLLNVAGERMGRNAVKAWTNGKGKAVEAVLDGLPMFDNAG